MPPPPPGASQCVPGAPGFGDATAFSDAPYNAAAAAAAASGSAGAAGRGQRSGAGPSAGGASAAAAAGRGEAGGGRLDFGGRRRASAPGGGGGTLCQGAEPRWHRLLHTLIIRAWPLTPQGSPRLMMLWVGGNRCRRVRRPPGKARRGGRGHAPGWWEGASRGQGLGGGGGWLCSLISRLTAWAPWLGPGVCAGPGGVRSAGSAGGRGGPPTKAQLAERLRAEEERVRHAAAALRDRGVTWLQFRAAAGARRSTSFPPTALLAC
jgi:hypothetical protein